MFTYNIFKRKSCLLENESIVINNVNFPIERLEQITGYKPRMYFVVFIMILATPLLFYMGYMGYQEEIINNPDLNDAIIRTGFLLFMLSALIFAWWGIIKSLREWSKCRSFWLINGKAVYIEQNDNINIEAMLEKAAIRMGNSSDLCATSIGQKIKNPRIVGKLLLFAVLIFSALFIYGMYFSDEKGNILKGELFVPIFVAVAFMIIILRCIEVLDDNRWKK